MDTKSRKPLVFLAENRKPDAQKKKNHKPQQTPKPKKSKFLGAKTEQPTKK